MNNDLLSSLHTIINKKTTSLTLAEAVYCSGLPTGKARALLAILATQGAEDAAYWLDEIGDCE